MDLSRYSSISRHVIEITLSIGHSNRGSQTGRESSLPDARMKELVNFVIRSRTAWLVSSTSLVLTLLLTAMSLDMLDMELYGSMFAKDEVLDLHHLFLSRIS